MSEKDELLKMITDSAYAMGIDLSEFWIDDAEDLELYALRFLASNMDIAFEGDAND
jgi:hypothetical protein